MDNKKIIGFERGVVSIVSFLKKMDVDLESRDHNHYKYSATSSAIMDLNIETWGSVDGDKRNPLIVSMAHYYKQNGDLMRDPEVVFRVYKIDENDKSIIYAVRPESFRQDGGLPIEQVVLRIEDGEVLLNKKGSNDIKTFLLQWIRNIKMQGHKMVVDT